MYSSVVDAYRYSSFMYCIFTYNTHFTNFPYGANITGYTYQNGLFWDLLLKIVSVL